MESLRISVIIPSLNEEELIKGAVNSAISGRAHEVIVVDGGSTDGTLQVIHSIEGVRLLSSPIKGRSAQMNYGAEISGGDVLLFLHADTLLPPGWKEGIIETLADVRIQGGCFGIALNNEGIIYRLTCLMMNTWTPLFRGFTGDQGIFVRRAFFQEAGEFPLVPIMEDLIFSDKIRKAGMGFIRKKITVSARKYEKEGPYKMTFLMWYLRILFRMGRSPEELAPYYREGKFPPLINRPKK